MSLLWSTRFRVVDTRAASDSIRRRRECQSCRKRFTTYEQISEALLIVKRDGRREPFDRYKLLQGLRIACAKRPIAMADIDRIVTQIEEHLFSLGKAEVRSEVIGEMVLEKLKELDRAGVHPFCHGLHGNGGRAGAAAGA